jgi:hypothetical protein
VPDDVPGDVREDVPEDVPVVNGLPLDPVDEPDTVVTPEACELPVAVIAEIGLLGVAVPTLPLA